MRREAVPVLFLSVCLLISVAAAAPAATVFVNRAAPGPVHDGHAWETAFLTVQEGIAAAASGDDVWVARGLYYEHIGIPDGVGVYGGFAGGETGISQRDIGQNATILDGSLAPGSVVTLAGGPATRVDGFTIRGGNAEGRPGGGICVGGSATVANNVVTGNRAYIGGGISLNGSATVSGNSITKNFSGAGSGIASFSDRSLIMNNVIATNCGVRWNGAQIFVFSASPTIASNVIAEPGATSFPTYYECVAGPGGYNVDVIVSPGSYPLIVNNTIAGKGSGSGIVFDNRDLWMPSGGGTVANNIFAFVGSAIFAYNPTPAVVGNNDFFGNSSNYSGPVTPGQDDITLDPQFVDRISGNYHLRPTSPCIDRGRDDVADAAWVDLDGEPRVRGIHVDIGADETGPISPVAKAGNDQTASVGQAVTLDGSGSYDPDKNYPLSYAWRISSAPAGSAAFLSGAGSVDPLFTPDAPGDYVVELVVTDNSGSSSAPDTVTVSTVNSPPMAEAGPDQSVVAIGTTVSLDGGGSFDIDGDAIRYLWTLVGVPEGSRAVLDNSASPTPTFAADVHGDFVIDLVVSDAWVSSRPDTVTVSLRNVAPVADAGVNQSVVQGDAVVLDGSASKDANLDPLTFAWSIVSAPDGSFAAVLDPAAVRTSFVADLPGQYVVSLSVNDGFIDSTPSNLTVVAISGLDAVKQEIGQLMLAVNGIDPGALRNGNMKNALGNKINAVLRMVEQGSYGTALDKLENDILGKTNGCAEAGAPDANDWITTCGSQAVVHPVIARIIDLLRNMR